MSLISSSPDLEIQPPADSSRLFSLDVLRGFALFGILIISIWEFGGFTTNEQLFYRNGTHGGNYKLMTVATVLFEGKMRALLSLVFGAGILLFLHKKEFPVNISRADAYIRRMMWLMGFGLVNAFILVWPGDILFHYGVMGILLFAFNRMKSKGFFIAAIICTLIYCGKQYWSYTEDRNDYRKYTTVIEVEKKFKADSTARAKRDSTIKAGGDTILPKGELEKMKLADSLAKKNDTLTKKQAEEKDKWEGTVKSLKYDSATTAANNKMMRASWNKVAYKLMPRTQQKESKWLYSIGIWDIGSLMFLGMALFSIGFFSARFTSSKYLLIALLTLAAGFALAWYRIHLQSVKLVDYAKYIDKHSMPYNQFFPAERILLATGYASLLLWLLRMKLKLFTWLWKALAAAGQMALTNYIMQTILCTFFFYGYGFGYFGRLQQWELYFFVAEVVLVQIVFSVLWLRYYEMGPLEWLWRCLVYRKWLPNKKPSTETIM